MKEQFKTGKYFMTFKYLNNYYYFSFYLNVVYINNGVWIQKLSYVHTISEASPTRPVGILIAQEKKWPGLKKKITDTGQYTEITRLSFNTALRH